MRGFTLIQLLISIALLVIIAIVTRINLFGARGSEDLQTTTAEIGVLLREAQSRSATQSQNALWGIHFDNVKTSTPFFALFSSPYASATVVGQYPLPPDVQFATSSVAAGTFLEITFAQISGAPSASTSITLNYTPGGRAGGAVNSSTISISSTTVSF